MQSDEDGGFLYHFVNRGIQILAGYIVIKLYILWLNWRDEQTYARQGWPKWDEESL